MIGWIGNSLLAICGVFEGYNSYKKGYSECSQLFLWAWFLGEVFTLYYVIEKWDLPLILNYGINIISILFIMRYRYFPVDK